MQNSVILSLALLLVVSAPVAAQRQGGAPRGGSVTFVVFVSDPSGTPLTDVKVSLSGGAERSFRTEAGRLVFEDLPAGTYLFRFEKDGFVPFEKELNARGSAPIDVKVTLTPLPPAPAPVVAPLPKAAPSAAPGPPPVDAKPVVLDMPEFIEKNYVGHASGKTTPLGCAPGGSATLLQINEPIANHAHADADEFLYVIAGQGMAQLGQRSESLGPGVYLLIPRGLAHTFTPGAQKPLVMIAIRAGGNCGG
jgi:mannose-6-phosphate isomerase-like protein (cupin superfamily)